MTEMMVPPLPIEDGPNHICVVLNSLTPTFCGMEYHPIRKGKISQKLRPGSVGEVTCFNTVRLSSDEVVDYNVWAPGMPPQLVGRADPAEWSRFIGDLYEIAIEQRSFWPGTVQAAERIILAKSLVVAQQYAPRFGAFSVSAAEYAYVTVIHGKNKSHLEDRTASFIRFDFQAVLQSRRPDPRRMPQMPYYSGIFSGCVFMICFFGMFVTTVGGGLLSGGVTLLVEAMAGTRSKLISNYATQVNAWQTAGYPALMTYNNFTSHMTLLNGTFISVAYWNSIGPPQAVPLTTSTVIDSLKDQNGYVQPYIESINYQGGLPPFQPSAGGVPVQAVAPSIGGYQQAAWPGPSSASWGNTVFTSPAGGTLSTPMYMCAIVGNSVQVTSNPTPCGFKAPTACNFYAVQLRVLTSLAILVEPSGGGGSGSAAGSSASRLIFKGFDTCETAFDAISTSSFSPAPGNIVPARMSSSDVAACGGMMTSYVNSTTAAPATAGPQLFVRSIMDPYYLVGGDTACSYNFGPTAAQLRAEGLPMVVVGTIMVAILCSCWSGVCCAVVRLRKRQRQFLAQIPPIMQPLGDGKTAPQPLLVQPAGAMSLPRQNHPAGYGEQLQPMQQYTQQPVQPQQYLQQHPPVQHQPMQPQQYQQQYQQQQPVRQQPRQHYQTHM